jgi:hypothetical protein
MNHISLLPEEKVPRDAEFKFRDRANALVDQWRQLLYANRPNDAEVATNGAIQVEEDNKGVETKETAPEGPMVQGEEQVKEEDAREITEAMETEDGTDS